MTEKIVTIAACLKNQGYATGQFGKNHLGDLNHMLPTNHGFDEFFGNLYHLNAEEEPEMDDYPTEKDFPNFAEMFGPRGVIHSWATDKDDPTEEPRWGKVGKQRDRGHRPAHQKAHGDLRRRIRRRRQGFHQAPERRGQAVLRLAQHHPHAPVHAHQAREPGQAGRWQSPYHDTMIDHDKNVGQMLDLLDELGIADDTFVMYSTDNGPHMNSLAGRRHDAVPQREEHQLGGRLPRSDAGALAGQDRGRARSPTRSSSITTGCRPSLPWPASRTSSRS